MKKMLTALWLLFSINLFSQTTYYVNDDATGANNGTSWKDAFTKLQDALAAAGVSGDQIWVAAGVYYPDEGVGLTDNDRNHSFFLKNGVALYGGFVGSETKLSERNWKANGTTLSGDIDQNDKVENGSKDNNSLHVVQSSKVDKTAALDGFTISAGNATGNYPDIFGGGMYNNEGCTPVVTNCSFAGNNASFDGGGMYNSRSSAPIVANCIFTGNTAIGGGGIFNYEYTTTILTDCIFSENTAYGSGGGVFNDWYSQSSLINCRFYRNTAKSGGGISNIPSYITLTNCIFKGNTADIGGGAITNWMTHPKFINCSFYANTAKSGGGVIHNTSASATLINCIIWGNGNQIYNDEESVPPFFTYSIVEGGYPGTGNLDQDPLFVDAANGDLHLKAGSPAIDKGLNSANATTVDLDGKPRIVNGTIDMGAYEFQGTPVVITSISANPSTLWPPDHKMKEVKVTTVSTGGSGATQCRITKVTSNEPQGGSGKDDVAPDWQIVGADKVLLRAERNGKGDGRIYTVTVTCTDAVGSSDSKSVQVKVPHDQGHKAGIVQAEGNAAAMAASGSLKAVPNPFSSQASVYFSVPQSGYTTVDVVDAAGVVVQRLYAAQAEAGRVYTLTLESKGLKSGVYVLRLATSKNVLTYRLVLMQ